jgi:hypothetical protein
MQNLVLDYPRAALALLAAAEAADLDADVRILPIARTFRRPILAALLRPSRGGRWKLFS